MVENTKQQVQQPWRLQELLATEHNDRKGEWNEADDAANVYAFEELRALSNTSCAICKGYGHAEKDCPTKGRLVNYGKQGGAIQSTVAVLMKRSSRSSRVVGGTPTVKTSLYK